MVFVRIIIDMDEVICDFLGELCKRHNQLTGANLCPDQIDSYDLTSFIGESGRRLFLKSGFFSGLKDFPNAIETIRKLHAEGHSITVATDAKGSSDVAADKKIWVENRLPLLSPENFVVTSKKYLLDGDLLFDDSPEMLNNFKGIKVVMDRPYNRSTEGHRILNNDWEEFYALVKRLAANAETQGL